MTPTLLLAVTLLVLTAWTSASVFAAPYYFTAAGYASQLKVQRSTRRASISEPPIGLIQCSCRRTRVHNSV